MAIMFQSAKHVIWVRGSLALIWASGPVTNIPSSRRCQRHIDVAQMTSCPVAQCHTRVGPHIHTAHQCIPVHQMKSNRMRTIAVQKESCLCARIRSSLSRVCFLSVPQLIYCCHSNTSPPFSTARVALQCISSLPWQHRQPTLLSPHWVSTSTAAAAPAG
jgi:hypothetical protein